MKRRTKEEKRADKRVAREVVDMRYRDMIALERGIGVHPRYRNRSSQFSKADAKAWEVLHRTRMNALATKWSEAAAP